MMNKLPPLEKIYEAYSAIADGRVSMGEGRATVLSSNKAKEYSVTWSDTAYSSNDNATQWQGYAGYPVIAVLMLQGILPLNKGIASLFAGINWTKANAAAKRDYAKAVELMLEQRGYDESTKQKIQAEAELLHKKMAGLNITIKRGGSRPKLNPVGK